MDCPADVMCIFMCGHVILIFFFLFISQLFMVSSDAEPDEDSGGGGGGWLEVCVCVSETSPCEWVVDDDPLLSALCVGGGPGPGPGPGP